MQPQDRVIGLEDLEVFVAVHQVQRICGRGVLLTVVEADFELLASVMLPAQAHQIDPQLRACAPQVRLQRDGFLVKLDPFRRYEEGIELYKKAIALQPDLWGARSQLGINLMRLGREHDAREQLEISFNNGQKDAATTNTLNLMDSYKNFQIFETNNTILRLHKKEAELLRPYIESELKRAIATYEKKYQIKLDRPVQLEVYPDHEDFAVRTMGMPGLGALGVTFGYVVAMDSPSGRRPGSFHWDSTLWHELSHVFVLSATKHRVPRWFTEGMAVHEETAASPDWGDRLDPQVIGAIKGKKLLPVTELY